MMLPFTMWLWRTSGIMMQPPHCVGLQLDYRAENTGDDSVAFFNVASGGIVRDSNIRWLIYSCFVHCNWFFFLQWLLRSRNSALQFSDNPAWGEIYWKRSKLLTFDQTWLLHSGTKVKFDLKENKSGLVLSPIEKCCQCSSFFQGNHVVRCPVLFEDPSNLLFDRCIISQHCQ